MTPTSAGEPPEQLKGFDKVTLNPGQTADVSIPLGSQSFSIRSSSHQAWVEARVCTESWWAIRRPIFRLKATVSIS